MKQDSLDSSGLVVAISGLRKSFGGVEVLHGVDLTVRGGRVLALLGENGAGKSTTIKVLTGDYRADAGAITVDGEVVDVRNPRVARDLGFRVIYQEFSDAPDLTVAENISLGALASRGGFVRWGAVQQRAVEVLRQLDVDLDPRRSVGQLGVAERQILEIARAMAGSARLLVLDEPTSALSAEEVERLFTFVRRLRDRGVAIVYITHRLDEVNALADDVVIFRDGYVAASGSVGSFDRAAMIESMIGRELGEEIAELRASGPADPVAAPALRLDGVTRDGVFEGVHLEAPAGLITAIFGRVGCGAVELAESVFGMHTLTSGTFTAGGRGQPRSPAEAIRLGIGFVPADRKVQGLLAGLSVSDNLSVASWPRLADHGVLRRSVLERVWERWRDVLSITAKRGARQDVATLSGGNQQKTVLGRWLERECSVLVLVEPTRGVDVGARAELYRVLEGLARRGTAVLVVSSDIEEVIRLADTVHVMLRGHVVAAYARPNIERSALIAAASADTTAEVSV
jgi:ribose transport system ATP-binding protein